MGTIERMSVEEIISKLAESKLFMSVPRDEIEDLVKKNVGRQSYFDKGKVLIGEGETWNSLDVILKGRIVVKRLFRNGEESVIHQLREKYIIGMEFLRKADYESQFYYVTEEETLIYSIHKWNFTDYRQMGEKVSFQMLKNLIGVLSHENIRQHRRLDILSERDLRGKITAYLNYEQKKKNTTVFDIPYNREALAAYLCVNRSALSRELGRMEKEGLLKTKGKHFVLSEEPKSLP